MRRLRSILKFSLFLGLMSLVLITYRGCSLDDLWRRAETYVESLLMPRTPRETFSDQYDWDRVGGVAARSGWEKSFVDANSQDLWIELPHREILVPSRGYSLSAQAYRFQLPAGRVVTITAVGDTTQVFGELYRVGSDGRRQGAPVAVWEPDRPTLKYEPNQGSESLFFALQPLPGTRVSAQNPRELIFTTKAALLFPVAGGDERAIKSFWGDSRDGGRRRHEGNDIFAPKGTPLVAVTKGTIRKTGNAGLGGKTIWLHDAQRGQSYYYAHLDEQYVRRGQRVQRGDTIGTVGNTGNARTTPPHLHFGVYANGAYDPNPLLQPDDAAPAAPQYPLPSASAALRVPIRGKHFLRRSPTRTGQVHRQLENGEAVTGVGVSGRFYRVLTRRGEWGYVNFD